MLIDISADLLWTGQQVEMDRSQNELTIDIFIHWKPIKRINSAVPCKLHFSIFASFNHI